MAKSSHVPVSKAKLADKADNVAVESTPANPMSTDANNIRFAAEVEAWMTQHTHGQTLTESKSDGTTVSFTFSGGDIVTGNIEAIAGFTSVSGLDAYIDERTANRQRGSV